jgi:CBS domain-containing protein
VRKENIMSEQIAHQDLAHQDLVALPVVEMMSHPVISVTTTAVLGDVLAAMVRTGLRHLAVVDHYDRCIGVVGDRAVAAAWAADPNALSCTGVRHVLDRRPSVVGADATMGDVARAMYLDGVDAVAVIDRTGRPVGMVTGGDLVALMATHVGDTSDDQEPTDRDLVSDVTGGDPGDP